MNLHLFQADYLAPISGKPASWFLTKVKRRTRRKTKEIVVTLHMVKAWVPPWVKG